MEVGARAAVPFQGVAAAALVEILVHSAPVEALVPSAILFVMA